MDLDEIRRKRIKLFDPKDSDIDEAPAPSVISQSDIEEDARIAREMVAELERSEDLQAQSDNGAPTSLTRDAPSALDDEKFARAIQTEYDEADDQPGDQFYDLPPFHSPLRKKSTTAPEFTMAPVIAHDVDETGDAVAVRRFAKNIVTRDCGECRRPHPLTRGELMKMFTAAFVVSKEVVNLQLTCGDCGAIICLGCGKTVTPESTLGFAESDRRLFKWHCDTGRMALIWVLLCGYDSQVKHNRPNTAVRTSQPEEYNARSDKLAGIGYSARGSIPGIGYSGSHDDPFELNDDLEGGKISNTQFGSFIQPHHGNPADTWGHFRTLTSESGMPSKRSGQADTDDELTTQLLKALVGLLPSFNGDWDPPASLASMLQRSSILSRAAELLRNDSLNDATQNFLIYDPLLQFMRASARGGDVTKSILHSERVINKAGHNLLKVTYELPTRMTCEPVETSTSLALCMSDLASQSTVVLKNARANAAEFQTTNSEQMLQLCAQIVECADIICTQRSMIAQAQGKVSGSVDDEAWQKEHAVMEVLDKVIFEQHFFAKDAAKLANPPVGRMRHLIKEVSVLKTSLPPGIFLRYGESRLDVMKILIVGPRDTPYENGLFEFDLLCPTDYPYSPPIMRFKTTGGGIVTFNPNLYANGKVCLSLLGTWEGESWQPGKSTLLQVFVSLQAMIFVDEPHCNEPGQEDERGTELSRNYNRSIYHSVVRYGMIEWLEGKRSLLKRTKSASSEDSIEDGLRGLVDKTPDGPGVGVWDEVSRKHFEVNQADIIKTVDQWVHDKPAEDMKKKKPSAFLGTGWAGRVLGDGYEETEENAASSTPHDCKQDVNLISKLKGALRTLETTGRLANDDWMTGYEDPLY